MKEQAIIVDLDGTLCNTEHRQHFMQQKPKDWKSFYAGILRDKPNLWCQLLIEGMRTQMRVLFVSGRPDDYAADTIDWLERHGFENHSLYMRKAGDYRKDSVVKAEIYKENIEPHYNVIFCVDDRQQVVDAWRELGLTCLQCAKGDF